MNKHRINLEQVTACPVCGAVSPEPFFEAAAPEYLTDVDVTTFPLGKCTRCEFVFLLLRPVPEDLVHYYPQTCPNFKSSVSTSLERLVHALVSSKEVPTTLRVLDVGFGAGDFLQQCFSQGHACYGVDFSEHAYAEAKKKNPELSLFCGLLYDAGYQRDFFDWINLAHVLEHEYDPKKLLTYIHGLLKPGGKVTIHVPNYGGLYYAVAKHRAEYFVPQHVNFFTPQSMHKLITQLGFKDFTIKPEFGNNLSYHILKSIGLQKSFYAKSILNQVLGLAVLPIENILNKGDVISVTAYK